jgi:hypothetical protein
MCTEAESIRSDPGLFQGSILGIGWAIEEKYELTQVTQCTSRNLNSIQLSRVVTWTKLLSHVLTHLFMWRYTSEDEHHAINSCITLSVLSLVCPDVLGRCSETDNIVEVEVEVTLRPTVSRPIRFGILPLLEQVTRCYIYLSDNYFLYFLYKAPSLTRGWGFNLQCNDTSSISSYIPTDGLSARSSCRAPNGGP